MEPFWEGGIWFGLVFILIKIKLKTKKLKKIFKNVLVKRLNVKQIYFNKNQIKNQKNIFKSSCQEAQYETKCWRHTGWAKNICLFQNILTWQLLSVHPVDQKPNNEGRRPWTHNYTVYRDEDKCASSAGGLCQCPMSSTQLRCAPKCNDDRTNSTTKLLWCGRTI